MKKWLSMALLAAVVVSSSGCIVLPSGGTNSIPTIIPKQSTADEDSSSPEQAQVPAAFIGETIVDKNNVHFCVTSVTDTQKLGDEYNEVTTENNFIVVSIKITNNGSEAYDVNTGNFVLLEGGNKYEYCSKALFTVDNHMYLDTLNPALSKEYAIVYETPTKSTEKDWQMGVMYNAFWDTDMVYINLREK